MHADTLDVDVIQPLITEEMVQQQRLCQDPEAPTKSLRENALALRTEVVQLYKSRPYDDRCVYNYHVTNASFEVYALAHLRERFYRYLGLFNSLFTFL